MSGAWRWILLYVLALVVLQFAVYYYLQRKEGDVLASAAGNGGGGPPRSSSPGGSDDEGWSEGPGWGATETQQWTRAPDESEHDPVEDDSIRCPHCGAVNDRASTIRYCRGCLGELGIR